MQAEKFAAQAEQAATSVAPTTFEYVPEGQLVHTLTPAALEYVPAEQLVQLVAVLAPDI